MKRILSITVLFICCTHLLFAQSNTSLVSGPWAGGVELKSAIIWLEVKPSVKSVDVVIKPGFDNAPSSTVHYAGLLGQDFNPIKIALNGLAINTAYEYTIKLDGKPVKVDFPTTFKTQELWQYRKPAPDFTFLAGSCAYFNEPAVDRPGKPYGGDSSIFETMTKTPAAFHVWMGDNWYTREVDYSTAWGMNYRPSHDRAFRVLQPFMASMPQYAIWDDHDFGPNDAGKSFIFKAESREIFKKYTTNPTYGEDGKGIYTKVTYSDVDLFLTDDRYFRSEEDMKDSIYGALNPAKNYFGSQQLDWLENALLYSNATFKIIVTGSQVLNPLNRFECMRAYPFEYNRLMNFLQEHDIKGVLFFTGDRHHSEVIKMERAGRYPLYDVTISPYTAGISKASGPEKDNPYRMPNTLVEAQNFGRITVSGKRNERILKVDFIGLKGDVLGSWSVPETDLKK